MNEVESASVKTFLKFVIPSVLSQWVYALYTMVDGMFVAKGVGELGLTAVNLSSPILQMLFALSLLFAVGTSTVTAILLGGGERRRACEIFTQNVVVQIVLAFVIMAAVMPNLPQLARLLGAREQKTADYVIEYLKCILPCTPFFLLSYTFEVLLKTDGFPGKTAAIVLAGVVENCVLDWLFVMVMRTGVQGAAVATSMSQCTVTVLYVFHFIKRRGSIYFTKFVFQFKILLREIKNGASAAVTELSAGLVTWIFNWTISAFLRPEALVSYAIVSYINSIVVFSSNGIVQGSQPLISYYYGKRDRRCCKKLFQYCLAGAAVFCLASTAACWVLVRPVAAFYISDNLTGLREYSVMVARVFSLAFPALGINVVVSGYLAAMERAGSSIVISLGRSCAGLLLGLAGLIALLGGEGIWLAPLVSETGCLGVSYLLVRRIRRRMSVQGQ